MRRVRRHTECNNIVFLTIELEIDRMVALVAVEDQDSICALRTVFRVFIEVFNPIEAFLVCSPPVFGLCYYPVGRHWGVFVPG